MAGLLGVRGDRIEADEGEEHDRRPQHDSRQAVGGEGTPRRVVDGDQPAVQSHHAQQAPGDGLSFFSPFFHQGRQFRHRLAVGVVGGQIGLELVGAFRRFRGRQPALSLELLHFPLLPGDAATGHQLFFQSRRTRLGELAALVEIVLDQVRDRLFLGQMPPRHGDRRPMRRTDISPTHEHDEADDRQFRRHERGVGLDALANAEHEHGRHRGDEKHRRQVEDAGDSVRRRPGVVGEAGGNRRQPHGGEQFVEVSAPGRGHRGAAHRVFEDQVPADEPGEDFAQRRVGVGVGAAGHRGHGGELGVAQGGEGAAQPGDGVGDRHRGPGVEGRGPAGHHEDARPNDAADAQRGQRHRPEDAVQAVFAGRLGEEEFQVLAGEKLFLPVHDRVCPVSEFEARRFISPGFTLCVPLLACPAVPFCTGHPTANQHCWTSQQRHTTINTQHWQEHCHPGSSRRVGRKGNRSAAGRAT